MMDDRQYGIASRFVFVLDSGKLGLIKIYILTGPSGLIGRYSSLKIARRELKRAKRLVKP